MNTQSGVAKLALAMFAITAVAIFLLNQRATRPAAAQSGVTLTGVQVTPVQTGHVNMAELARQEALLPSTPESGRGVEVPFNEQVESEDAAGPHAGLSPKVPRAPSESSIGPSFSYQGLDDISAGGFYYVPPDTMGAVGLTRTLDTLNNNYRVQEKYTGVVVSTVTMNNFWASTGGTKLFDPKTLYDPYNDRFIVAAVSNSASIASSIEFGISSGSDPNGAFTLYRIPACTVSFPCGAGITDWWADYPAMGFNQNWVVISVNMFPNAGGAFTQSRVFVIDYSGLRAGSPTVTIFIGISDFTVQPCVTHSDTENILYAPNHFSSSGASYRVNTITGTAGSPFYNQGILKAHTLSPLSGGWTQPSGNILPQLIGSAGITDVLKVDSGDARIYRCAFRNGNIWYAQTVYLPAGGVGTHTAAQWVRLDTNGDDVDGGRVEDPTATATNGGQWYAYPTLDVNKFNDVLMGFSQFSSNHWPSAGYSYRAGTGPAGTMRDPYIYKAGEGMYWKTFNCLSSTARNRWGDYSATQVDPVDDTAMWTLQEYSKPEGSVFAANGCNSGVWSTWWARVSPSRLFMPLISLP